MALKAVGSLSVAECRAERVLDHLVESGYGGSVYGYAGGLQNVLFGSGNAESQRCLRWLKYMKGASFAL